MSRKTLDKPRSDKADSGYKGGQERYQERLDRYGNPFGNRVSTKQTRVPPPPPTETRPGKSDNVTWRKISAEQETNETGYKSPSFTRTRETRDARNGINRPLFPQRETREWRVKNPHQSQNDLSQQNPTRYQTEDEIRKDLDEATLRYVNHPDPTEAAARRQRVLATDTNGQTEETASYIMRANGIAPDKEKSNYQSPQLDNSSTRDKIFQEVQNATL
ncbi:unnamed protein product [Eruca vesicaria subsp. sativa]|uniref:Uncharacterized protein n=1 Tax=Eruca vesicaria subsp. sativa TaxID=29727 RepID=A0ABC8JWS3_ERUVS|nr:unnamed protein product [Eruca vesicaria subsp. sativa]